MLRAEVDARGQRIEYVYDDRGQRVEAIHPDGTSVHWSYDAAGRMVSMTDELGHTTTYAYDKAGRMTETVFPDATPADPSDNPRILTEYDAAGRVIAVTDPAGTRSRREYDAAGRLIGAFDCSCVGGPGTTFAYDAAGQLVSSTDALGRVTRYLYDDAGRSVGEIDASGNATATVYDTPSRTIRQIDPLGRVTTTTLDPLGRVVATVDALGQSTETVYDELGNPIRQTGIDGQTSTAEYNRNGQLVAGTSPAGERREVGYNEIGKIAWSRDAAGTLTTMTYDDNGRLVEVHYADGTTETSTYDAAGRLIAQTDRLQRTWTTAYDAQGRKVSETDPLNQTKTYVYDAAGRLLEESDPLGQTTTYTYDIYGRVLSVTDAEGGVTAHTYDRVGNLESVTDPAGNRTTYTYDDLNRVETETDQLGNVRQYAYDDVGNLVRQIDRNGRVREFAYDDLNRLTDENWVDGSGAIVNTIHTEYDQLGRAESVADSNSSYSYTYDVFGRLAGVSTAGTPGMPTFELTMGYDSAGRRASVAATVNGVADFLNTYVFDAFGRIEQISQVGVTSGSEVAEKRVEFGYNAAGQLQQIDRYRDATGANLVAASAYLYDGAGRLEGLTHTGSGGTLAGYAWTFDAAGRVTLMTSSADGTTAYEYDGTSQITAADHATGSDESFAYDENGNRTAGGYVTGPDNRLLADGRYTYEYDDEGNRVRRTETATGEVTDYEWDYRNRLTRVTTRTAGGIVLQDSAFTYDVFDRRIAATFDADGTGPAGTETTWFAYLDDDVALEFDGNGAVTRRYLHGPATDQVLAVETVDRPLGASDRVLWPLADHQMSVRDVADQTGAAAGHRLYDAFGLPVSSTGVTLSEVRFGFTGREYDVGTGLYYYRARWYDAATGRFLSQDPLGLSPDTNPYRYVGNNPANLTDPTGLDFSAGSVGTGVSGSATVSGASAAGVAAAGATATAKASSFSTISLLKLLGAGGAAGGTFFAPFAAIYSIQPPALGPDIGTVAVAAPAPVLEPVLAPDLLMAARPPRYRIETKVEAERAVRTLCTAFLPGFQTWTWSNYMNREGRLYREVVGPPLLSGQFSQLEDRVDFAFTRVADGSQQSAGGSRGARNWVNRYFGNLYSAGHVISATFGGPGSLGNIIPQSERSQGMQGAYENTLAPQFVENAAGANCVLVSLLYPPDPDPPTRLSNSQREVEQRIPRMILWAYAMYDSSDNYIRSGGDAFGNP
jgi:RHS repeat-associated protein